MKNEQINNKKGFTIIEVLIAVLILSFGILGTGALLVTVIKTNHLGNHMSKATTAAQLTMEEVRQKQFFNILSSSPNYSLTDVDTGGYDYPSSFTRTVEVIDIDVDGVWAKYVKVTVNFASFGPHKVILESVIAR